MRRNKGKKENPPARLLWTMFLLVLGLVVVYATLALGIYSLVQQLLRLACWACLPPRWAPGWPAAGSGCGSF